MISNEELQALLERQGISDFLYPRTFKETNGIGLFQLANDYWGTVFKINPPAYMGDDTEKKLSTFFTTDLPDGTIIQLNTYASRNVKYFINKYEFLHPGNLSDIKNPEILKELVNNKIKWLKDAPNKSILDSHFDYRIRDFVNLLVIMIPKKDKNGFLYKEDQILGFMNRTKGAISDFSPQLWGQKDYVRFLREVINPDFPLWTPSEDKMTMLNHQIMDDKSIIELKDDGSISFGSEKTNKQIKEEQTKKNYLFNEKMNNENNEKIGFFQKIINTLSGVSDNENFIDESQRIHSNWHAKVLTTKMYPEQMSLYETMNSFFSIFGDEPENPLPCPFINNLTIVLENRDKIISEIKKTNAWNLWQTNALGDTGRFFPEIQMRSEEAEFVMQAIDRLGEIPMRSMWSLIVFDNNKIKLNQYVENIKNKLMIKNWYLQEETQIPFPILLHSLPLQYHEVFKTFSKKFTTLFKSNQAAISPLLNGSKGFGSPILSYVDRTGQIMGGDIFDSDTNYNFIFIGGSGSGKSYLQADFQMQYLSTGALIRVIDVGRSYKRLCDLVGGQYIEFTDDTSICLNFFTNIITDDNGNIHEDEINSIVPLIGMMAKQNLDTSNSSKSVGSSDDMNKAVISSYVSQAITLAYEIKGKQAGMQEVVEALHIILDKQKSEDEGVLDFRIRDLIESLYPYSDPRGEFYSYFNGENNLNFNNDYVVLELEELEKKGDLKFVVLMAITNSINHEFYFNRDRKKILIIDEAWALMDNIIVIKFLETLFRRIRKYNGAAGVITQSIGDFYKNEATQSLYNNSAWKFYLKQDPDSINYAQSSNKVNFDPFKIELFKSISSRPPFFSEIMITGGGFGTMVGRLITDKVAHWIYTNHPKDVAYIEVVKNKFNIDELDAALIIGNSMQNKTSEEEEYSKRFKVKAMKKKEEQEELL